MRLKIATTSFLIAGVLLLLAWPFAIGPKPVQASQKELAEYALRILIYFGITATTFLVTAILALLLVRQARRDFAKEAKENLKGLIEGTLRDHDRKRNP